MEIKSSAAGFPDIIRCILQKYGEIAREDRLYEIIAELLHGLVPQSVVVINAYDRISGLFQLRAIYAKDINLQEVALSLEINPIGMSLPLSREMCSTALQGRLSRLGSGIYDMGAGLLTPEVSSAISKQFSITEVYTIGFACGDVLYGSAWFLLRSQVKNINFEQVEILASLISGILQSRSAELVALPH